MLLAVEVVCSPQEVRHHPQLYAPVDWIRIMTSTTNRRFLDSVESDDVSLSNQIADIAKVPRAGVKTNTKTQESRRNG